MSEKCAESSWDCGFSNITSKTEMNVLFSEFSERDLFLCFANELAAL